MSVESEADKLADRLLVLLGEAHAAYKRGDVSAALLFLAEAKAVAEQLPKKKDKPQ